MSDSATTAIKNLSDNADQFDDADNLKDVQNASVGNGEIQNALSSTDSADGAVEEPKRTTAKVALKLEDIADQLDEADNYKIDRNKAVGSWENQNQADAHPANHAANGAEKDTVPNTATVAMKIAESDDQFDDADDNNSDQNGDSGNSENQNQADAIPDSISADQDIVPTTTQVAIRASTSSVGKVDEEVVDKEKIHVASLKVESRKAEANATAAADSLVDINASTTSHDRMRDGGEESETKPPDAAKTESEKTETKARTSPDSPGKAQVAGSATPVPKVDTMPLSTSSPLDALASIACVAEERRQIKESAMYPPGKSPKTPKEGTRVNADEICCTDGMKSLLWLLWLAVTYLSSLTLTSSNFQYSVEEVDNPIIT